MIAEDVLGGRPVMSRQADETGNSLAGSPTCRPCQHQPSS